MTSMSESGQYGRLAGRFAATTAVAALLFAGSEPARSENTVDTIRQLTVETHPSQGDMTMIEGSRAQLKTTEEGIFARLETSQLSPGHVLTMWVVVINNPAACESSPCTGKDIFARTSEVLADVVYGDGIIVDSDGRGTFTAFQERGPLDGGWLGSGLTNPMGAEVVLVVNDHGPLIEGEEADMLTSYRGGCTEASIPGLFPATARALGKPGPNTCRLVQVAHFVPAN